MPSTALGTDGGINDICWDDLEPPEKRLNTVAFAHTTVASYMRIRHVRMGSRRAALLRTGSVVAGAQRGPGREDLPSRIGVLSRGHAPPFALYSAASTLPSDFAAGASSSTCRPPACCRSCAAAGEPTSACPRSRASRCSWAARATPVRRQSSAWTRRAWRCTTARYELQGVRGTGTGPTSRERPCVCRS